MSKQTDKARKDAGSLGDRIAATLDVTGHVAGLPEVGRQRLEDAKDGLLSAFLGIREAADQSLTGSTANLQKGLSFVKTSARHAVHDQKAAAEKTMSSGSRRTASFAKRRALPLAAGAVAIGIVAGLLFAWKRSGKTMGTSAPTSDLERDADGYEASSGGRRSWDGPSMAAQVGRIS